MPAGHRAVYGSPYQYATTLSNELLAEWVHECDPKPGKERGITRDERQLVAKGGGRDLLVDRIFRSGDAQTTHTWASS